MTRTIELIQTTQLRGKGAEGDPVRHVDQLFTLDGRLVAQRDPCDLTSTGQFHPEQLAWARPVTIDIWTGPNG